ncbi:MAG: UxaA family hydrolase [Sedimentibacter sp.]
MEANSVFLNNKDNVITASVDIKTGENAYYFKNMECVEILVTEDVRAYHKIALEDINISEIVVKYGESIGKATKKIKKGGLVDHTNINSIPRDYQNEMVRC